LNYKVILSYDGNHFHGFQKQPSIITVQQVIEKALSNLLQNFEITYAGRTDAGVHAKHQVLSVVTDEKISESFKTSFNALVGKHIYIKQIKIAKESFHPRYDAIERTYKYFVNTPSNFEPYNLGYSYLINEELDISNLNFYAESFLGVNNFTNFSKLRKDQEPTREITVSKWTRNSQFFIYTISGNSFLHNMVRSLVGIQLACQSGKINKASIDSALKKPQKARFNYVAPPEGLYLWKIKY